MGCRVFFNPVFNIEFLIKSYVFWDSDNSLSDANLRLDEAIAESNFESPYAHILIAFTDQYIKEAWGITNRVKGAVLVRHYYELVYSEQYTDNILQHELSHLYQAENHIYEPIMCIMAYKHWKDTNDWCSSCRDVIMSNRELWGGPKSGGGGGGRILIAPVP